MRECYAIMFGILSRLFADTRMGSNSGGSVQGHRWDLTLTTQLTYGWVSGMHGICAVALLLPGFDQIKHGGKGHKRRETMDHTVTKEPMVNPSLPCGLSQFRVSKSITLE